MTVTCQTLEDTLRPLPGVPGMGGEDDAARHIVAPATLGAYSSSSSSSSASGAGKAAAPVGRGATAAAAAAPGAPPSAALDLARRLLRPIEDPFKSSGHITILRGNVAPGGSVAK